MQWRAFVLARGWSPETDVGPLISAASNLASKVIINQALVEGAELLLDGREVSVPN
jgi:acyl-CoA reductase-like NAD-dependent aldehyde dehydrogenase